MNKDKINPCTLCVNDLHIGKDNISEFTKNWNEVLSVCKEHDIKDIIVGGDLFQSRSGQTLGILLAVMDALKKASENGLKVYLANGNHDYVDQESDKGYCHVFSELPNVFVVDEHLRIPYGYELVVIVMSYYPEKGSFPERIKNITQSINKNMRNILYCHQGINGGLGKPSSDEVPTSLFIGFDKVLVGHYHNRKCIPDTNIEYIGASRQHNFGEDIYKGYTIIYSDGSTKFIQNQVNIRYRTIDVTSVEEAKTILATNDELTRIKVRLTVSSDMAASINKEELLALGASKVEIIAIAESSCAKVSDLNTKYDKAGLREEYERFCIQKGIDNVELGLSYLDKIDYSCGN